MNKKFKARLQAAFDAPPPTRKSEFLQSINFPKANRFDFIFSQIGYIRRRVWILSCLLVTSALVGLRVLANGDSLNFIWIVSSVLPFVSLMTITELARSMSYNMAELEMSCKYNFADIVLARLGILSCFNISVFGLIIFTLFDTVNFGIFRLGIYLLVPFMLTCMISLFVFTHLHSRETTYICCAISCFVSIANAVFANQYEIFFSEEYFILWIAGFVILTVWIIIEAVKLIKKTEELQWNLL